MGEEKKTYCANVSYGKDSLAMLHVVTDVLHWPLDRVITADVWATDTIQADLPPMVDFKNHADRIIKERWGIEVEHFSAVWPDGTRRTFENMFYKELKPSGQQFRDEKWTKRNMMQIYGFPMVKGPWCNSKLKIAALKIAAKEASGGISYIGIASDEPLRIARQKDRPEIKLPLVEAGWTEPMCREWCEENDLLSPLYENASRGGCWFCFNKSLDELRQLRHEYPKLWELLLNWDKDSPFAFRMDGRTVRDLDKRFQLEDMGYFKCGERFAWKDIETAQMNIFQFLGKDNKDD